MNTNYMILSNHFFYLRTTENNEIAENEIHGITGIDPMGDGHPHQFSHRPVEMRFTCLNWGGIIWM